MVAMIAAGGACVLIALTLVRLFMGPTLHDRALAAHAALTKAALVCAAIAALMGQSLWLDVAFAIALGGFVLSVAVLKVFRAGTFQPPLAVDEKGR